jgi:hypothetical protein
MAAGGRPSLSVLPDSALVYASYRENIKTEATLFSPPKFLTGYLQRNKTIRDSVLQAFHPDSDEQGEAIKALQFLPGSLMTNA